MVLLAEKDGLLAHGRRSLASVASGTLTELFAIQDERMGTTCQELVARLEKVEDWSPEDEVRLRLEDV